MDVDISRLTHLIKTLESAGADKAVLRRVLDRSGLTQQELSPDARGFAYATEAKFVREACDALADLTFGARAGLTWRISNSLTGYIGKYSKTLRAAIENTGRFHEIVDPALKYQLRMAGNFASFEVIWKDPAYAKFHRHTEFLMFAVLARMRIITQSRFYPIEMRFTHDVRKSARDFQKLAGFPVAFGAETLEIVLPLPVLDLPIPTYDLRLREHLTEYGERLLTEQGRLNPSLRSKVEGLLMTGLPARMLGADEVAASLGMSARTFARRLSEEGTSFRAIVDALRLDLAKTFMKDGMSLSEIAFSLGYADHAAFSTAFKRWTGVAPSTFVART